MNITDKPAINCVNRESYPIGSPKWITKFIKPHFIPRHVMPQYFQEALNISRLLQHYFEGEMM